MGKWKEFLNIESQKEYFIQLQEDIKEERKNYNIFPKKNDIFNAFKITQFENIKIVIIGQDPYHASGQAHGLSFSVKKGIKIPPSLKNIFKELHMNLKIKIPNSGDLTSWAMQGVFLLNATLTVTEGKPGSHQKLGWEQFTDNAIKDISDNKKNVVFILWGRYARSKKYLINKDDHLILEAAHPSPLSAYNGFFGTDHFSRSNQYLAQNNIPIINWNSVNEQKQKYYTCKEFKLDDTSLITNLFNQDTIVLFPTDTVWGLHTNYYNSNGIEALKRLKQRDDSKPFIVITDSLTKIKSLDINIKSYRFIEKVSKLGPITFIVNCEKGKTIAIRIPQQKWLTKLLSAIDYPLVSTSANITNKVMCKSKKELFSIFEDKVHIIDDGIEELETTSSTLIDMSIDDNIHLIREGKIKFKQIEELWES